MDRMEAKKQVCQSIIEAIRTSGRRGFGESQIRCPVKTGNLRKSGLVKDLDKGVEVDYTIEYASEVERGTRAGIRNVRQHFRKGFPVRPYSYYSRGQKANPFIEESLRDALSDLSTDLDSALRSSIVDGKVRIER